MGRDPTESGQISGQWLAQRATGDANWKETGPSRPPSKLRASRVNRRGSDSVYTGENSTKVQYVLIYFLSIIRTGP